MAASTKDGSARRGSRWRLAIWGGSVLLLLLPLLGMQFSDEVDWDAADFIALGAMLAAACGSFELAAWKSDNRAYRTAVGVALVAGFALVWLNLAVGIIGTEDNPANLMFAGVLAVAIVGAMLARLRPDGMALAMLATALAQALVAVIVLLGESGKAFVLTSCFVVPWLLSAWFFRKAAQDEGPAGTAQ